MRGWLIAAPVLLLVLAGCADGPREGPQVAVPESVQNVEVSATKGAIRGIVLDETVKPLAGAAVAVTGVQEIKTTAADGGFVFGGLEPGDYFLTVSKPGYVAIQSSAQVVAGQAEPPLVKIILTADPTKAPFVELQNWKAFLQCGAGVPLGGSWNPCLFTGSDNVRYFAFGAGVLPMFGQAEAVWEGTQPLGNTLWLQFGTQRGVGESPMVHRLDADGIDESAGDDDEDIMVRVFAGDESPTVVINQAYDIYVSYFYHFVPREGYMFAIDGPCDPVQSCM